MSHLQIGSNPTTLFLGDGTTPAPGAVTVAQLKTDGGSEGETRVISDPTYPEANGNVTWVPSDPLPGATPGGKSRDWARYEDGSGGYWRRNDWNALTVAEGAVNGISLDWAAIDENEDITIIVQELLDQYFNGTTGNVLSMKGLESVSEVVLGHLSKTGDTTASAWYWYRPTTNKCIIRSKPYPLGTENLLLKSWTSLGSNRWSASVTETVDRLAVADPDVKAASHTGTSLGPWPFAFVKEASAAAVTTPFRFHYGSGTLTVYSTADPSTHWDEAWYVTDGSLLDNFAHITNATTIYIEGRTSRFDSNAGMEFRGRAGQAPMAGVGSSKAAWEFDYIQGQMSPLPNGATVYFVAGISETASYGFRTITSPTSLKRLEKLTIGGISQCRYAFGAGGVVSEWIHFHKGDTTGDKFSNNRPWGEHGFGWDGSISAAGTTGSGATNLFTGRTWPLQYIDVMSNCVKVTGHGEGFNSIPFNYVPSGTTTIGESINDPLKVTLRGGNFGIDGDFATYSPNGRPVLFVENVSSVPQFGKSDVFYSVRGGTNFLHIDNPGIVNRDGVVQTVDISLTNLAKVANPEDLDLGLRWPFVTFEVTIPEETSGAGNAGLDLLLTGDGQGVIQFGEIDERYPYNWQGYHTVHGESTPADCHMQVNEITSYFTIDDLKFTNMFAAGKVAVSILNPATFIKPNNNTIGSGVTLDGNRVIQIGGDQDGGKYQGPYKTILESGLTITGTTRTAIEVAPFLAGEFNEGHPITIIADGTANWDANMVVDNPGAQHTDDVYFSDNNGTTWYEVPWTKGGSNTTKSAPPDLIGLNYAWRNFNGTNVPLYMPQFFADGNHVTVVLWFNGDPGTITPASGFNAISGASANLSDNSLYVRAYERSYVTGTDCWNENGRLVTKTFSWVNTVSGWGYSTEHTGQNATPIGNANSTAHNTASTSHTAPTITASTDSMIMSFIGIAGNAGQISDFGGSLSPWMTRMWKDVSVWGAEGTDAFFNAADVGVSFCAAEIYSGASGSKAGCAYTVDSSVKAITTSIEIKT